MTDMDISGYFAALREAIKGDNDALGLSAMTFIAEGIALDLNRIANALEYLSARLSP